MIALTLAGLMALAALPLAARRPPRPSQPDCWIVDSHPHLRGAANGSDERATDGVGEARSFASHCGGSIAAAPIQALLVRRLAADAFIGPTRKGATAAAPILIPADIVARVEAAMTGRADGADPDRTSDAHEVSAILH
jgi:hypothetical protein